MKTGSYTLILLFLKKIENSNENWKRYVNSKIATDRHTLLGDQWFLGCFGPFNWRKIIGKKKKIYHAFFSKRIKK